MSFTRRRFIQATGAAAAATALPVRAQAGPIRLGLMTVKTGPKNFINRLYLADALWEYEKSRRAEARSMLEALVKDTPSAEYPVEDTVRTVLESGLPEPAKALLVEVFRTGGLAKPDSSKLKPDSGTFKDESGGA